MKPIPHPPRWAEKLLWWLHPSQTLEEVAGDLAELYAYWYAQSGKNHADFRYGLAVLSVVHPYVRCRKRISSYKPKPITPFNGS